MSRPDTPASPEKRQHRGPQPRQDGTPVVDPPRRRFLGRTCEKLLDSGKKCRGGATRSSGYTRCPRHGDAPPEEKARWWFEGGIRATQADGIPDAPPVELDTIPKITTFCGDLATEGMRGRLHENRIVALEKVANTARLTIETAARIEHWERLFGLERRGHRTPRIDVRIQPFAVVPAPNEIRQTRVTEPSQAEASRGELDAALVPVRHGWRRDLP